MYSTLQIKNKDDFNFSYSEVQGKYEAHKCVHTHLMWGWAVDDFTSFLRWTIPLRLGGCYPRCSICLQRAVRHIVWCHQQSECNIQLRWTCFCQDRFQTLSHLLPLCSVQNVLRLFGSIPPHNWNAVLLQTDPHQTTMRSGPWAVEDR